MTGLADGAKSVPLGFQKASWAVPIFAAAITRNRHEPHWVDLPPDGEGGPVAESEKGIGLEKLFPPNLSSIPAARRFAEEVLCDVAVDLDEIVLLVSELATNAVIHAKTDFAVRIRIDPLPVRVELQDWSPNQPDLLNPGIDEPSGRGIMIVDAFASSWGVSFHEIGKRVWFEYESQQGRSISDRPAG
jgi:hypothetical protein